MKADLYLVLTDDKGVKTPYRLERLPKGSWRLHKRHEPDKAAADPYTVSAERHGLTCTCADWIYRKQNSQDTCKHVRAMVEFGLIEDSRRRAPEPQTEEPF